MNHSLCVKVRVINQFRKHQPVGGTYVNGVENATEVVSREVLRNIPPAISLRESWSWWRKRLNRPSDIDALRMNAWLRLIQKLAALDGASLPKPIGLRRAGIFGESIVRADFLQRYEHEGFALYGLASEGGSFRNRILRCPAGNLASTRQISLFEFSLTDVNGIAASKSSGRHFKSISDFGFDYVTYKKESIDAAGLARMLDHCEMRIMLPDTSERVGIRAWDGRLFLYNAGGSHHFAGASYISAATGQIVPLRAHLEFIELTVGAVTWLLDEFVSFSVPQTVARPIRHVVAQLLGHAYACEVPAILSPDTAFLFLPRSSPFCPFVADAMKKAGLVDCAPWFASLLEAQQANRSILEQRFPAIFQS